MNLPEYKDIKLRQSQDGKYEVLDILRHKFVSLTPEEWVRQHFVNMLITYKGYPAGLLGNEVELAIGDKKLRCDSVLFGSDRKPRMIIEYKAESIPLTEKVITQITTYNMLLHVSYLIVSNGNQHLCLHYNMETKRWNILPDIPSYNDL